MTDRHLNPGHGSTTNSGAGGAGAPWTTFQYAVGGTSALAPGDTLYVHAGTYNERVVFGIDGTAGNPITITNYAGDTPILAGANGQEHIFVIANGIEYITISGDLYFSYGHAMPGGNNRFPWINITGTATNHITVENVTLERTPWTDLVDLADNVWEENAIQVIDAKDVTINNVTIRGTRLGVVLDGQCLRATVKFCDIGYTGQSCILLGSAGTVEHNIVIYRNILHHSAKEDGMQFAPPYPISDADKAADTSNRGTWVAYNDFVENGENGIDCKSTHHVVIEGNRFRGMAGSNDGWHRTLGSNRNSQAIAGAGANTYSETVIFRNNIVFDCPSGVAARVGWKMHNNTFVYLKRDYTGSGSDLAKSTAIFQARTSKDVVGIRNNIFAGNKYDSEVMSGTNQPNNEVDLDYNLYASLGWRDTSTGNAYTTLGAWQTRLAANNWRYGKDGHSIAMGGTTLAARHNAIKFTSVSATPTSGGTYDFGLQADSPAKRTGGYLCRITGGAGSGVTIPVEDAHWFSTNFGRDDYVPKQRIFFNGQERTVEAVNYATDTITINATATWGNLAPIYHVFPLQVASATPDIGALDWLVADGGGTPPPPPPPPPPPGGPGGRAAVRAALNTTTGNQTFTFATPLTGTPIAWRFTLSLATADDTPVDGAILSRGWAWDSGAGIVEGAVNMRSRHGQASSSTSHRTITDGCIVLPLHTSTAIDGQASFVSGDANGVTINITDAFSAAFLLTVEAFVATAAYFGTFAISQTQDTYTTVTPGFEPNWGEVVTFNKAIPDAAGAVRMSQGYFTRTSTTITQQCVILSERNSVTPTQMGAQIRNDYVGGNISDATAALLNGLLIDNLAGTTLRVNTKNAAHLETDAEGFLFCLLFEQEVYSGIITTPTATNAAYDYAVGFEPGSANVIATMLTATNTAAIDATAGAYGVGMWDGAVQYMTSIADEDAAATTNTQSQSDDRFVNLDKHDGTAGHVAEVVGAETNNLRVNHSVVTGAANKWILVAVGEPFVATVTAAFSGTPLTGIKPVTVVFTDASTADGTTITTRAWDFGDGGTSTATNPSHTYTDAGSYTVTLTVSDGTAINTLVKSDYVVVAEPPDVTLPVTSLVLASGIPEPVQVYNNVLASGEVVP